jgi:S-layer protein
MATFTGNNAVYQLYVGYFGRAGDPGGSQYWINQINAGAITLQNMAASFSLQPEAIAKYPFLAAPSIANVGAFIDQVYLNLFNHLPDAGGKAYWTAQLTASIGNPTAVGNFILNVISGATGTDNTTIINKVDVAGDFTTKAATAGTTFGAAAIAQSSTELAATNDTAASVTAQKAATDAFIATAPGPISPLTINQDNLSTTGNNATFNAPLFTVPTTGVLLQTLSFGDTLVSTGTGASLVAVLNASTTPVVNITMTGVPRADFTVTGATAVTGSATGITGLTTVNNNGSTAGLTLGAAGNGLKTALTTVNINNFALGGTGNAQTSIIAAAALAGTADAITVNVTGTFGATGVIGTVAFGSDGAVGTTATPQNAYEIMNINTAGASFLNISGAGAGGVLSTTTLNLSGAGAMTLQQATAAGGDFARLATINATTDAGGVTITGASQATNGLLTGNTALTSFKGGSGADSLDLSGLTAAQVQAFTATNLDGGTGRDTLILSGAAGFLAAQTTTALNATGFEIIGVAGATTGTYNIANLGSGVDTLALVNLAAAAQIFTVSNPAANMTFGYGAGFSNTGLLTVAGGTGITDTFNVTATDVAAAADALGAQTFTLMEFVNYTISAGTGANGLTIGGITASASPGQVTTLTITDNNAGNLLTTGALGVGVGTIKFAGTATGGITTGAASTASFVDASALNTAAGGTSGGNGLNLFAGFTAAVALTGSNASDNVLGSAGADTINTGAGNDIIRTSGGLDTFTGGAGNDQFTIEAKATVATVANVVRITDFKVSGTDTIALDATNNGGAGAILTGVTLAAGNGFAGVALITDNTSVATLANVYTALAANATLTAALTGSVAGAATLIAAQVTFTTGAAAGTYLVIDDSTAGAFVAANDLVINVTGINGNVLAANLTVV